MNKDVSDLFLLAIPLFLSGRAARSSPSSSTSLPAPELPPPGEVERVRTGDDDPNIWRFKRLAMIVANLRGEVPDTKLEPISLSLLAQWAHETARGRSEFNFNLGGWRARPNDPFFTARDVLGAPGKFRWTAYPDLPTAVTDQMRRLQTGFPSAWSLLVDNPESSAWVSELGRRGYYEANPETYARAWAMHRTELGSLPL